MQGLPQQILHILERVTAYAQRGSRVLRVTSSGPALASLGKEPGQRISTAPPLYVQPDSDL